MGQKVLPGHRGVCEARKVTEEVRKKINLSMAEMETLLRGSPRDCLACNCGLDFNHFRTTEVLEGLVTSAVLKARGLRARQALSKVDWDKVKNRVAVFDGPKGQLIRIDFKNRRRIIDE